MKRFAERLLVLYRVGRDLAVFVAIWLAVANFQDVRAARILGSEALRRVHALWRRVEHPPQPRRLVRPDALLAHDESVRR